MPLVTAFDGISTQHVGDLYTRSKATVALHSRAQITYMTAVNDLAFGIVLSDQIHFAPAYPRYAESEDAPGYDLHTMLLDKAPDIFAVKKEPIKSNVAFAKPGGTLPKDVLVAAQYSIRTERSLWLDFIEREIRTYYPFPEHYQDCDLGIDETEIAKLFPSLQNDLGDSVSSVSYTAFAKRALGAHILGDYRTSTLDWDVPGRVVRIPHGTRTSVHLKRIDFGDRAKAESTIRTWVAPQVLGYALRRPLRRPEELFDELLKMRGDRDFSLLRESFSSAIAEWDDARSAAGLEELARRVEEFGEKTEMLPASGDFVPLDVLESPEFLRGVFRFKWQEVCEKLERVFPTLKGEGSVTKYVVNNSQGIFNLGNGTISGVTFQQFVESPDTKTQLVEELARLRDQLNTSPVNLSINVADLVQAEQAARDGEWAVLAGVLKRGGEKLLELATRAGLTVLVEAIAKSNGWT